jgi:hypothetical protein
MFPLAHKEEDFFSVFSYMTRFDLQFLIFIWSEQPSFRRVVYIEVS